MSDCGGWPEINQIYGGIEWIENYSDVKWMCESSARFQLYDFKMESICCRQANWCPYNGLIEPSRREDIEDVLIIVTIKWTNLSISFREKDASGPVHVMQSDRVICLFLWKGFESSRLIKRTFGDCTLCKMKLNSLSSLLTAFFCRVHHEGPAWTVKPLQALQ